MLQLQGTSVRLVAADKSLLFNYLLMEGLQFILLIPAN
jgi:hypothetical protein